MYAVHVSIGQKCRLGRKKFFRISCTNVDAHPGANMQDGKQIAAYLQGLPVGSTIQISTKDKDLSEEWRPATAIKQQSCWSLCYEDCPDTAIVFTDDNEDDSLLNPDNWTIGWYNLDEAKTNSGNLASNQPELLECARYELCGEQETIQIENGNEFSSWRLYSMCAYAGVNYLKPMKQVRISQLQNEVHIFSFVAAKIIDGNPSVDEANHFAIIYNLNNCRLEFVKLEQVQKIIQEEELVSFEVPRIVAALERFMTSPIFNEFKPESKAPGDVGKDDNAIPVDENVLKVPCADTQLNHGKENENLERDARDGNKRKRNGKTRQTETNSHVLTSQRTRKPAVKYDSSLVELPTRTKGRPKPARAPQPTKRTKIFPAVQNPSVQNILQPQKQKENLLRAPCANQFEPTKEKFANESAQIANVNSGQHNFSAVQHCSGTEKQPLSMEQFGYMGPNGFVPLQQPQPALFPWPFSSTNCAFPPSMTALHGNPFGISNPFPMMHQMQDQLRQTQQTPRESDTAQVARCMLASQLMGMMSNFFR